ncbi:hypothetical protein BDM02DRAFT_2293867 [Thelephora ganbajun]|uniref:Uncharacterized protein n=1 Tax=Thelephora ganbajun TaxID=370292 RepID=A0ACB6ZF39_THEGA|nr:hypothetical protein BDM02DRAFT_2293867 [Thelephora ganbajun]
MALNVWKITPERAAVRLVRAILRDSPSPLTTKEIYKEAVRREVRRAYPHPPTVIASASAQQPGKLVKKRGVVHLPPAPPHPENAIRSVRYLKTIVLPHMRDKIQEIEKFHAVRTLSDEEIQHRLATMSKSARKAKGDSLPTTTDVWLWKARERPSPPPEPKREKPAFGIEVGVGGDWSHLNKRRQRARVEKVARDVTWLKDLVNIRRERAVLEKAAEKETTA